MTEAFIMKSGIYESMTRTTIRNMFIPSTPIHDIDESVVKWRTAAMTPHRPGPTSGSPGYRSSAVMMMKKTYRKRSVMQRHIKIRMCCK